MLVPVKGVKVYPNNKPRVAPEIAAIRKQRQEMHKSGNTAGVRILQRNINGKIKENKKFRKKVEENFISSSSRQLWKNLQTMTRYKPSKKHLDVADAQKFANELNVFYARFGQTDFSAKDCVGTSKEKQ